VAQFDKDSLGGKEPNYAITPADSDEGRRAKSYKQFVGGSAMEGRASATCTSCATIVSVFSLAIAKEGKIVLLHGWITGILPLGIELKKFLSLLIGKFSSVNCLRRDNQEFARIISLFFWIAEAFTEVEGISNSRICG